MLQTAVLSFIYMLDLGQLLVYIHVIHFFVHFTFRCVEFDNILSALSRPRNRKAAFFIHQGLGRNHDGFHSLPMREPPILIERMQEVESLSE